MPLGRPLGGNKRAEQYSNAGKFGGRPPSGSASGAASTVAMTDGTEKAQGTSGAEAPPAPLHACGAASSVDMAGGIEQAQGAAAPSAPRHAGGEASAEDMADGSTPLRLKLIRRFKQRVLMFEQSDEKDSDGLLLRRALARVSPFGSDGVEPYIIGGARMVEEGVPLLPRTGGRARVHGDVPPAKRGRSKSEESGALVGTMYCQLLDYFLTTALQKNLALRKDDIVDMALGYLEMAVPRPIPPARVEEHVRGVFSELLKHATQRASGRPLAAGEAFDPSVHAWDAAATYEDWERAYTAAFSVPPPASILPLSILRERRAADAARVIAEAERLAASKFVDPKLACYNIGERAPCPHGCGASVFHGEGTFCCRGGEQILGAAYNPPISPEYLELISCHGFSANSRFLNDRLSFAAPLTSPSRGEGGLGYTTHQGGFLHVLGKAYALLRSLLSGPSGFDVYRVPDNVIYDGAEMDMGRDFANQLIGVRNYLLRQHPMARRLVPIVDAPGEHVDLSGMITIDARSAPTGRLEMAALSSGVRPPAGSNFVMIFNMGRNARGEAATPSTVSPHNALWELLQWPLLFEEGIGGYFSNYGAGGKQVTSTAGIKLSLRDYSRAMLFQNARMGYAGRLMQEWLLAQYSRQVDNSLHYLQSAAFQKRLKRAEGDPVLVRREDHRAGDGGVRGGERIRMPASVVGSKAYNQALTDDTLAITGAHGKSTCFLTMTCNPMWKEIQEALLPGQSWTDRPDIVCRVFKLKQQELLRDLHDGTFFKTKEGLPWKCKYVISVVEFQKRGLPHAHILFRLVGDEDDMPKRGADVDRLISARMPEEPKGHEEGCCCDAHRVRRLVQQHMMHKCAANVCFPRDGPRVCKRRYPRPTDVAETTTDDSGYPVYQRTHPDDANVVPFNRAALLKYECHINLELVSTAWVIKYVHKYLHKGPDTLRINTTQLRKALSARMNINNEVEMFQQFRYLSAGEAFYRTVNFPMHATTVGCTRLSCHLEGKDWVGKESDAEESQLLAYFKRPVPLEALKFTTYYANFNVSKASEADLAAHVVGGGDLLYEPGGGASSFYVDGSVPRNKVAERRGMHVARMYTVPVTKGEHYYLRLLLTHVPARSFEALRTHGATTYDTFREAAEAHGLLTTEREFIDALGRDVMQCETTTPADLRHTFAMMVLQGGDKVPVTDLYERFKYYMATDLTIAGHACSPGNYAEAVYCRLDWAAWREYDPDDPDNVRDLAEHPVHEFHLLRKLQELIESNSASTLEDFGLPSPGAFAKRRVAGSSRPDIERFLEQALYVAPGMEQPLGDDAKHVAFLRSHFARTLPELLTGSALKALHRGAPQGEAVAANHLIYVDPLAEEARFNEIYATLNAEQRVFADAALAGLVHQKARADALAEGRPVPPLPAGTSALFHLQARGGRGKSYVTKCIIAKALSMGLVVVVSAFSGVAAVLLPGGQTCHRTYGLMIDVSEPLPSPLSTGCAQGKLLGVASLHIIDEVECLHRYLFEAAADVSTRCVNAMWGTATKEPFGGAMAIISGDWHQTLPITTGFSNDEVTINSLVRSSHLFSRFKTTVLTLAERNKGDASLDAWQSALSVNRAPGPDELADGEEPPTARRVFVPTGAGVFATVDEDKALEWLFGDGVNPRHAMLCATNSTVDSINDKVLDRYVPGTVILAHAAHERAEQSEGAGGGDAMSKTYATVEYMATARQHGVPAATLRLKKGCVLLLTRNLLNSLGLVNGTRLILLSDPPAEGDSLRVLHVQTVPPEGSRAPPTDFFLPRINFSMTTPGGLMFVRRQFPVRLAYATTPNKAQGQTLIKVCVDTRHENFSHGTGYVSNSRTRTFSHLGYLHAPPLPGKQPTFVNVVLQRALTAGRLDAHVQQREPVEVVDYSSDESGEDAPWATRLQERNVARPARPVAGAMSQTERRKQINRAARGE